MTLFSLQKYTGCCKKYMEQPALNLETIYETGAMCAKVEATATFNISREQIVSVALAWKYARYNVESILNVPLRS